MRRATTTPETAHPFQARNKEGLNLNMTNHTQRPHLHLAAALLLALAVVSAAGCASTPSTENRVTCSKAKDAGFFTIMFAAVGLSFRVAEADTRQVCADDQVAPKAPAAAVSAAGK